VLTSVGDRVGTGSFRLHSRFRKVANFHNRSEFVSVVDERVGPGPLHLVVSRFDPTRFSRLRVTEECVELDGIRFPACCADRYDSSFPGRMGVSDRFPRNRDLLGELLVREAPDESLAFLLREEVPSFFRTGFRAEVALHVRHCVDLLFSKGSLQGARGMSGCGFGFTPSGDDFLVGLLLGTHLLERVERADLSTVRAKILAAALRGDPAADTRLRLAGGGRLFPVQRRLVHALLDAGEEEMRSRTRDLLLLGSTSGADMGTGLFLTLCGGAARWS